MKCSHSYIKYFIFFIVVCYAQTALGTELEKVCTTTSDLVYEHWGKLAIAVAYLYVSVRALGAGNYQLFGISTFITFVSSLVMAAMSKGGVFFAD
jgi:hypothetical protein